MSIARHRLHREKNAGAYMEQDPLGNWVQYDDHAAEVAALTERAETAELRATLAESQARLSSGLNKAACKQRDLLRAECEAWRAVDKLQAEENDTGDDAVGMAEARYTLHRAMAATDAAKALGAEPKGGE